MPPDGPPVALLRFALVGGVAAALHAGVLLLLPRLGVPTAAANLAGFLLASCWGYLAHALFTFRHQTGGQPFARRWLLLQVVLNIGLSLGLPPLLGGQARRAPGVMLLVFTPTLVNLVLWTLAARHRERQRRWAARRPPIDPLPPRFHADDLGLDPAVNGAIFRLHDAGHLHGASLLLNGPALAEAVAGLVERPRLDLCLHLCLSEGPPLADPAAIPLLLDRRGHLASGFGRLLLASLLPGWLAWRRRLQEQLALEIRAQILVFQRLTGVGAPALDGHQHVHLLPIVLDRLLALEPGLRPRWLRRLREPLPAGVPPEGWAAALARGGLAKWLLLRGLDRWQARRLAGAGIASNRAFAGVLFTGRMAGPALAAGWAKLAADRGEGMAPLVLLHPQLPGHRCGPLPGFGPSRLFYASPWRGREYEALEGFVPAAPGAAGSWSVPVTRRTK